MRTVRGSGLVLGLIVGFMLGAPVALSDVDAPLANTALSVFIVDAAADDGDSARVTASDGSDGNGGNAGVGGYEAVHDAGNVREDASSSVSIGAITTPDAIAPDVHVNARLVTDPVLVIAGSFRDTGVEVFAPDGHGAVQAGTTGDDRLTVDATGDHSGNAGDGGPAHGAAGEGGRDTVDDVSP
jgi:hypothetical protein